MSYVDHACFGVDQALQQELDLKEAEMEELLMQLAELGSNQMRSDEEKAELRQQYEERIQQANVKVRCWLAGWTLYFAQ